MRSSRLPSLKGLARRGNLGHSLLPGKVTNLGLALSMRPPKLYGGRIWAESEAEGKSSMFTVLLPFVGLQAAGDP